MAVHVRVQLAVVYTLAVSVIELDDLECGIRRGGRREDGGVPLQTLEF